MENDPAIGFAEILNDPGYRRAVNVAWENDPINYVKQQAEAEDILINAQRIAGNKAKADWEARRQLAIASLYGADFGVFGDYIHTRGGETMPSNDDISSLDQGEPGPVKTNSDILAAKTLYEDPIDFLDNALRQIDSRKLQGPNSVGPENYATAIKIFTDKHREFSSQNLSKSKTQELIARWAAGFAFTAQKDKPNFIEMTNIYAAVRHLPKDSFPSDFSKVLIWHSLEQLPTYHRNISPVLFGALAKLPNQEAGNELAVLIDLAMRQFNSFETTQEMRLTLRAIANLKPSNDADRAVANFLELRNNLEEPMDLDGFDETNELLLRVVKKVLSSPDLSTKVKAMALTCAKRAVMLFKAALASDDYAESRLEAMKTQTERIATNYMAI